MAEGQPHAGRDHCRPKKEDRSTALFSVATLIGVFLAGVVTGFHLLVAVCVLADRDPAGDP